MALLTASFMALLGLAPAHAGETRKLSLYQVHTKESLTVTYKKNGRYVPSAMKKINYILRDWRRDAVTRMDPKTIDLMWELHADLGSRKPIHIISGYRSSKTNAMLRRIGRRVARRSRHIKGQAIDMYFPDVPISKVRGSALVRQVGGVGYYPRSGKHGFVHIDSGNVRHWPRMSPTRLASVKRKHAKTVNARRYRKNTPVLAFASAEQAKPKGPIVIRPKGLNKPVTLARAVVPKPIKRPTQQIALATADTNDVQVVPVAAEVPRKNFGADAARMSDMASLITSTTTEIDDPNDQRSNIAAKSSLTKEILNGTTRNTPTIRPLLTATQPVEEESGNWWSYMFSPIESFLRRDGAGQRFAKGDNAMPVISERETQQFNELVSASMVEENRVDVDTLVPVQVSVISGKSDRLVVNHAAKGDRLINAPMTILKRQTSSAAQLRKTVLSSRDDSVLMEADKPISFE